MQMITHQIIYPEGDIQEIPHRLRVNQLVDLNGYPLAIPLPTSKMIVYRVYKMHTSQKLGEDIIDYYLELVPSVELEELAR